MATFITTMHFTEQGIKAVRDTCDRAAAFKATAKKVGVKVTGIYWTLGAFDGVIVCEVPDEETATAVGMVFCGIRATPEPKVFQLVSGASVSGRPTSA